MANVTRWVTTPIDTLAPYSYRFTLLRVPMESLVELMTARIKVSAWKCDMYVDPSDGPRVTRMNSPMREWPALLKLGYDEFCGGSNGEDEGSTCIVAETVNPEWSFLLNFEKVFSEFNNDYFRHHFSSGNSCAPVPNFGCIDVVRRPDSEALDNDGCKFTIKGIRGIQAMGHGLIPDGDYFNEIGVLVGDRGGHRQILDWPIDDDRYHYSGIQKMISRKGRVVDRFTDRDMIDLMRQVYGLDVFSADFYTGNIIVIDSGYYRESYDVKYVDLYRDQYMPGWRAEGSRYGLFDISV